MVVWIQNYPGGVGGGRRDKSTVLEFQKFQNFQDDLNLWAMILLIRCVIRNYTLMNIWFCGSTQQRNPWKIGIGKFNRNWWNHNRLVGWREKNIKEKHWICSQLNYTVACKLWKLLLTIACIWLLTLWAIEFHQKHKFLKF